jgi:colanic acid biosynthesis glycosyl transferase WcaI
LLQTSQVCLVTQRIGTGAFFFPSKLLSLWQAGCPVVAVADSGGALESEIRSSGGGWIVPAENSEALADTLATLSETAESSLRARGEAGRLWSRRYERDAVLSEWLRRVQSQSEAQK